MKRTLLTMSALALVSALSACGGGKEAANNVAAENDMNAMMADAGPFADAEMRMNDAMTAAVGVSAADNWVRKMIEHHRGGVGIARAALEQNPSAHIADMARTIIDKQTREIGDLEKLIQQGQPDQASARLYQPAMTWMHDAMMAAKGADLSETFHRKMLEHHKGAVAMTDVLLRQHGVPATVRAKAEQTKRDQRKEIEMIEEMLRGEPAPAAPTARHPAAPTTAAKPAVPKSAPAKPAAASPAPATKPAEPKAADPTCLPEHRAAGHC